MQVCHVVVFIQEGSCFDTQILKKFRVLQAAKQAMAPYVKSQALSPSGSGSPFVSPSGRAASGKSSNNPSPVKSRGMFNRNNSAITLMSGLGSYTSLLPGQCTPVTLFVFLDDFADDYPSSNDEEPADIYSGNQSSTVGTSARPSLAPKGSGSVVVLARPLSKSEGGFRKKLRSSLEAQIRFSIKKCRTLSGSETGHTGSRSGSVSNSATLFSLDAAKAVALLDITSNKKGESLEFATGLVEDILNGKATSDSLLFESHGQSANREDLLVIKEFICRQTDILRGRGGVLSNTNSGPASGVGMVAVAAAAAAASAASGKTFTSPPELPHLEKWLSTSQLILQAILSAKHATADETEISKKKPGQRNSVSPPLEGNAPKVSDPLEIAMSYLASGRGINSRFSTLRCQKALPVAKETYLNELPPCYPTSQHKAHLERALRAFNSMVKGPAVQLYLQKLEDECTSIWTSGRQLCDAVSLTGKPCMHQRHDVESGSLCSSDEIKPHTSGYVFLHACACGRSRLLRPDPFDFEKANVTFNSMDCDKLLPAIQLPPGSDTGGPIQPSAWSLIRVGNARYYQPSKGLMQSGFSSTQKFLLRWSILLEKPKYENGLLSSYSEQANINRLSSNARDEPNTVSGIEKNDDLSVENGYQIQKKSSAGNIKTDDKVNNLGKGVSNFNMRKAFSEVVAGSTSANSGFPPLQSNRQIMSNSENSNKSKSAREEGREKINGITDEQVSEKIALVPPSHEVKNDSTVVSHDATKGNQIFQIGAHFDSMKMNRIEKTRPVTSSKHATVYIGFEHECPRGHRFILTADHLNKLGSPYALPIESVISSSLENIDHKGVGPSRGGKNGGHGKARRLANGMISTSSRKFRNKSNEELDDGNSNIVGPAQFSRHPLHAASGKDLETGLQSVDLNDSGYASSLLDRSLPIYMNCPHCIELKNKNDQTDVRFAGTISQLQRIFLATPHFPVTLAANPVIQFEESCLPPSVPDRKKKLQFCLGCRVILPPESFLSLRLPFVYGVPLENGHLHPLMPFEEQPELTAWITKGTTLQLISNDSNQDELFT
ncbi:unnamed protein product [Withania somnifera]